MTKRKSPLFTTKVPLVHSPSCTLVRPDLLLVIKEGHPSVACLDSQADLSRLIRMVEDHLEELKDYKWAQDRAKATKKR
jgi:hypothetical protein